MAEALRIVRRGRALACDCVLPRRMLCSTPRGPWRMEPPPAAYLPVLLCEGACAPKLRRRSVPTPPK